MKTITFLIGMPGSGKSSWLKEKRLEHLAVNPDSIRYTLGGLTNNSNGLAQINHTFEKEVWRLTFESIERRIKAGGDIFFDATNLDLKSYNKLKNIIKQYKYSVYYKLFETENLEEDIKNNKDRGNNKISTSILEKMRVKYDNLKIPKRFREYNISFRKIEYTNFDKYSEIFIIGDIHGNYDPLENFLDNYLNTEALYIFVGDYIDRGPRNGDVVNKLMEINKNYNCQFLEGNHERWLERWARDKGEIRSHVFNNYTKYDLDKVCDKSEVLEFTKKLVPYSTFSYNQQKYIVSHAGVATTDILDYTSEDMIKGVGNYIELKKIYKSFSSSSKETNMAINIHGHRNINNLPIIVDDYNINLEGEVFKDGYLRVVQLIDNDILPLKFKSDYNFFEANLIDNMRQSSDIKEKVFGHISSFNFTKDTFYNKRWNSIVNKARGLFINNITGEVLARSWDKFFNYTELEETKLSNLKNTLKYPINVFHKYNGSLGIVSYDSYDDEVKYFSKSTPEGEFAERVKKNLYYLDEKIKKISKNLNVSLIFEILEPILDPHTIKYDKPKVVLLDAIHNEMSYSKLPYDKLEEISKELGVELKKIEKIIYNNKHLEEFLGKDTSKVKFEGYVFEDNKGYLFKLKTEYYNKNKLITLINEFEKSWLKSFNYKDMSTEEIRGRYKALREKQKNNRLTE